MKPTIILIVISIIGISCSDGEINGKPYKTKWVCTKSHRVNTTRIQNVGKSIMILPYTYDKCDSGYYDTIFGTK